MECLNLGLFSTALKKNVIYEIVPACMGKHR